MSEPSDVTAIVTMVRAGDGIDQTRFINWLVKLMMACTVQPNFWSVELLAPDGKHSDWSLIQRFGTRDDASNWIVSESKRAIIQELSDIGNADTMVISDEFSHHGSAGTMATAIITYLKPGLERHYPEWQTKLQEVQISAPGFKSVYLSQDRNNQSQWTAVVRFDSPESLETWFNSPVRAHLLEESKQFVESRHVRTLTSSFPGWFPEDKETGQNPQKWKTAIIVLISLMPMMLFLRFIVGPLLSFIHPVPAAALSTIISVSFVTWVAMPLFVHIFTWWLLPKENNTASDLKGVLLAALILTAEVLIFIVLVPQS